MKNFWKKKKVLVTGASGFIGSHIVDLLIERGAIVYAQVGGNKKKYPNLKKSSKKIKLVVGDLMDLKFCLKASRGKDIILNFAAIDGGADFKKLHAAEILRTNSQIVLNILESARQNKVDRVLLVSSIVVYPITAALPIRENTKFSYSPSEIVDGYIYSKRFLEFAAKTYYDQYRLNVGIIRLSNVYGPRDHFDKGRVIPSFIAQACSNQPIILRNEGSQLMTVINVNDLSRTALDLIEKYDYFGPVNVGGEREITVKNLAKLIIKLTGSNSKLKYIKTSTKFRNRIPDMRMARKMIGFYEEVELEDGLKDVINFYLKTK